MLSPTQLGARLGYSLGVKQAGTLDSILASLGGGVTRGMNKFIPGNLGARLAAPSLSPFAKGEVAALQQLTRAPGADKAVLANKKALVKGLLDTAKQKRLADVGAGTVGAGIGGAAALASSGSDRNGAVLRM